MSNNTQKSYYPLLDSQSEFWNRVFYTSLEQDKPDLYSSAKSFTSEARSYLSEDVYRANIERLRIRAENEEKKELALMTSLTGSAPVGGKAQGEYIKAFNKLFSLKDIFYRNVGKIQKINDPRKGGAFVDITTRFPFYLRTEIQERGIETLNEEVLKEIVYNALIKMFSEKNSSKDQTQAYLELAHVIEQMGREGPAVSEMLRTFFGSDLSKISAELREGAVDGLDSSKISKSLFFQGIRGNKKGNVLELADRLVAEVIKKNFPKNANIEAIGTGASGMKTDNLISYFMTLTPEDVELLTQGGKGDASVRMRNVERMRQFYERLAASQAQGTIMEISDKNYSLTSQAFAEKKGFAAQTGFKLGHLDRFLHKMEMSETERKSLIYLFANTDELLVGGTDDEAPCRFLATQIGHFLFDDLNMDNIAPNVNAVHVLNLDGVYIPLSVFLRAAYYAFSNLKDPSLYVNVTFESNLNKREKETDGLDREDWDREFKKRLSEASVSIHFFGDFVNYIKANVQL